MKTIYKKDTLLKDGEVYVISKTIPPMIGYWCIDTYSNTPVYCSTENYGSDAFDYFEPITHSTAKLEGVTQLPREAFVKPVNYTALAIEEFGEDKVNRLVLDIFTKGHNANPNEFTREEMIKAMNAVHNNPLIVLDIPAYINHLRPLSLPASLEINEQGEIVNVIW